MSYLKKFQKNPLELVIETNKFKTISAFAPDERILSSYTSDEAPKIIISLMDKAGNVHTFSSLQNAGLYSYPKSSRAETKMLLRAFSCDNTYPWRIKSIEATNDEIWVHLYNFNHPTLTHKTILRSYRNTRLHLEVFHTNSPECATEKHSIWIRQSRKHHSIARVVSWTEDNANEIILSEACQRRDALHVFSATLHQDTILSSYIFYPLDRLLKLHFDSLGRATDDN